MKKRRIQKLGINKSTVSQLTQDLLTGGGTHTCHGHSCCPTEAPTCANTCGHTCHATCGTISPTDICPESRYCPA